MAFLNTKAQIILGLAYIPSRTVISLSAMAA